MITLLTICFPIFRSVRDAICLGACIVTLTCSADNLPKVTEVIRPILKDDYNYDDTVRLLDLIHVERYLIVSISAFLGF